MVYLFHVVEENTQKSLSFCECEETFKEEKPSNSFEKDRADVLTFSDRGSYFEREKLIGLDEEEQSRWGNETISARRSKIEDKGKDEPAEPESQDWSVKQLLQAIACKKIS